MAKNISRLYCEENGVIIAYEIYEGDVSVYLDECMFDGTDICPSVSDMLEYGVKDKWEMSQYFRTIVIRHLEEKDYE